MELEYYTPYEYSVLTEIIMQVLNIRKRVTLANHPLLNQNREKQV